MPTLENTPDVPVREEMVDDLVEVRFPELLSVNFNLIEQLIRWGIKLEEAIRRGTEGSSPSLNSTSKSEPPSTPLNYEQIKDALEYYHKLQASPLSAIVAEWMQIDQSAPTPAEASHTGSDSGLSIWTEKQFWTIEEAILLIFRRDPTADNGDLVGDELQAPDPRYLVLKAMAVQAVEMRQLSNPASPQSFLEWAVQNEILVEPCLGSTEDDAVPNAWRVKDLQNEVQKLTLELEAANEKLDTRVRNTMYKMIYLLAGRGNRITSEEEMLKFRAKITNWAQRCSITVDDESSKGPLEEAFRHVDGLILKAERAAAEKAKKGKK